jgi:hypothetical protein
LCDLIVRSIRELSTALAEAMNVVIETLDLLQPTMAKLTNTARLGVGALQVLYKGITELSPVVDPAGGRCSSQVHAKSARYRGMLLMMNRSLLAPLLWQARR